MAKTTTNIETQVDAELLRLGTVLVDSKASTAMLTPEGYAYPQPTKERGRGEYGIVHDIVHQSDTKQSMVIKTSIVSTLATKLIAYRDLSFMKALQTVTPQIVPKVYDRCMDLKSSRIGMIMEAFDCNVTELMKVTAQQYRDKVPGQSWYPKYILHERHLKQIIRIVEVLNQHKIIHGDIFFNQFLYRAQDDLIVLADFGFAGNICYKNKLLECPILGWPCDPRWIGYVGTTTAVSSTLDLQYLYESHPLASSNLMSYINFWELDAVLWLQNAYIWSDRGLLKYGRLSQHALPTLVEKTITKRCRQKNWNEDRSKWLQQQPCYIVS